MKLTNTIEDKNYLKGILDLGHKPKAKFSLGCFTSHLAKDFKIVDYYGEVTSVDEDGYCSWLNQAGVKMPPVNMNVITLV